MYVYMCKHKCMYICMYVCVCACVCVCVCVFVICIHTWIRKHIVFLYAYYIYKKKQKKTESDKPCCLALLPEKLIKVINAHRPKSITK